jgi:hypothetical protein
MILRTWSARATAVGAARYVQYFRESLLGTLRRFAMLLRFDGHVTHADVRLDARG